MMLTQATIETKVVVLNLSTPNEFVEATVLQIIYVGLIAAKCR